MTKNSFLQSSKLLLISGGFIDHAADSRRWVSLSGFRLEKLRCFVGQVEAEPVEDLDDGGEADADAKAEDAADLWPTL